MEELCDATASGAEVATMHIRIPPGILMFCDHHYRANWGALKKAYPRGQVTALDMTLVDAVMPPLVTTLQAAAGHPR